jgi:hypothetical protein
VGAQLDLIVQVVGGGIEREQDGLQFADRDADT